jgi:hypothetical protein
LTPAQWVKALKEQKAKSLAMASEPIHANITAERLGIANIGDTVDSPNSTVTSTTHGSEAGSDTTGSAPTTSGKPLSPDCRDGNHSKCDGVAWDIEADRTTFCLCPECGHPAKDLEL